MDIVPKEALLKKVKALLQVGLFTVWRNQSGYHLFGSNEE